MILADTNILIDVLANDPDWAAWSEEVLTQDAETDELTINPIIYAELSAAYRSAAALEKALISWPLVRLPPALQRHVPRGPRISELPQEGLAKRVMSSPVYN